MNLCPEAHQANTLSESRREGIEDIDSWVEPFRQLVIAAPGLIQLTDLLLNDSENGGGRVACLKLGGEWMSKEVVLCLFFVCFYGIIENELEVGQREIGRVNRGHMCGSE